MTPPVCVTPDAPIVVPVLSCPDCGRTLYCELRDYLAALRRPWPQCCGAEMTFHVGGGSAGRGR